MMYWYGSGMSAWGYALMTISLVLFWGLIIAGIVALIRYLNRSEGPRDRGTRGGGAEQPATPERLLAERFARGEIDEDEYWRRMAVLRNAGQAHAPSDGHARAT